jgi:hypothetical protein
MPSNGAAAMGKRGGLAAVEAEAPLVVTPCSLLAVLTSLSLRQSPAAPAVVVPPRSLTARRPATPAVSSRLRLAGVVIGPRLQAARRERVGAGARPWSGLAEARRWMGTPPPGDSL